MSDNEIDTRLSQLMNAIELRRLMEEMHKVNLENSRVIQQYIADRKEVHERIKFFADRPWLVGVLVLGVVAIFQGPTAAKAWREILYGPTSAPVYEAKPTPNNGVNPPPANGVGLFKSHSIKSESPVIVAASNQSDGVPKPIHDRLDELYRKRIKERRKPNASAGFHSAYGSQNGG